MGGCCVSKAYVVESSNKCLLDDVDKAVTLCLLLCFRVIIGDCSIKSKGWNERVN